MSVFSTILQNAINAGITKNGLGERSKIASAWFRAEAKKTSVTPQSLMRAGGGKLQQPGNVNTKNLKNDNSTGIGKMYLFGYDPKHKTTLPYYDRYPLIFLVGPAKGGFYGINMHYLPHRLRAVLMDALWDIANTKKITPGTKLKLSYNVLKGTANLAGFKPCFKHYLTKHVKTRFLQIDAKDWDTAIFLPLETFEKATKQEVWNDSRRKI